MPSRRCVLCEFLGAAAGVGGITPLGDQKFDESRMDAQASFLMPRPPVLVGFFAGTRPGEFSPGITIACHRCGRTEIRKRRAEPPRSGSNVQRRVAEGLR